jgi:hypothetical protein
VVLGAVAGARRTDSSLQRVVTDTRAADVFVSANNGLLSASQSHQLGHLPEVAQFAQILDAPIVPVTSKGVPDLAWLDSAQGNLMLANPDGFELHAIDRPGIIAGRLPSAEERDALVINETAAAIDHLGIGSTRRFAFFNANLAQSSGNSTIPKLLDFTTLTVVGIIRPLDDATRASDDPRLVPTLFLTRALTERTASLGYLFGGVRVRLHDPSQLVGFER